MPQLDLVVLENTRRLARKQAADNATEEYLLGRLEAEETGERALTMQECADKWGIKRSLIEHRLHRWRKRVMQEADEDDPGTMLGVMLNHVAQAMQAKKEQGRGD